MPGERMGGGGGDGDVKAVHKSGNSPDKTSVLGLRHALNVTWASVGSQGQGPKGGAQVRLRCGSVLVSPFSGNLLLRTIIKVLNFR